MLLLYEFEFAVVLLKQLYNCEADVFMILNDVTVGLIVDVGKRFHGLLAAILATVC